MAVQMIIDSAADISPAESKEMGILTLPLKVIFGDQEYEDYVDLNHTQFYEKLVKCKTLPTTCQIPPADFSAAYKKILSRGDDIIVVTLSSRLSGTCQSAKIAAEEYPGQVFVVDSLSVCLGERILIEYGIRLIKQGLSVKEIYNTLTEYRGKIRILALLDTLEYLKKGGRISAATALAGTLLSIKPVVTIEDGEVKMIGKARGSKQGNNLLRQLIEKCGGVNFDMPFSLAYSGVSDELLQRYIKDSADLWKGHADVLPISTVGCVIGTHVGPGAIAVAFFEA